MLSVLEVTAFLLVSNYKKSKGRIIRKKIKKRRVSKLYIQVDEAGGEKLEEAIKTAENVKRYRRLKVIDLSTQGQPVAKIGLIFELSEQTVRDYIDRDNQAGLEGLNPNYGQGRNQTITLNKDELSGVLERSPSQIEKLTTGGRNWTQSLMKQYLLEYPAIKVSQSALSAKFKQLGIP